MAVTIGIGIVGIAVIGRWRQALRDLDAMLDYRHEFLRSLETGPHLGILGLTYFSGEYEKICKTRRSGRFGSATRRLRFIFTSVFILVPLLMGILTLASTAPWAPSWIHVLVRPLLAHP